MRHSSPTNLKKSSPFSIHPVGLPCSLSPPSTPAPNTPSMHARQPNTPSNHSVPILISQWAHPQMLDASHLTYRYRFRCAANSQEQWHFPKVLHNGIKLSTISNSEESIRSLFSPRSKFPPADNVSSKALQLYDYASVWRIINRFSLIIWLTLFKTFFHRRSLCFLWHDSYTLIISFV